MAPADSRFDDIRDAVRAIRADFPDGYFHKVDAARACPSEFAEALTKAGWLAALTAQQFGGSGLGRREAANACLQFHGGFDCACEVDVEREFRETRLYRRAPISTNMLLSHIAEHVPGLLRSH